MFIAVTAGVSGPAGAADSSPSVPDSEGLYARGNEAASETESLTFYCEAARQGHGPSQFRAGQILAGDYKSKRLTIDDVEDRRARIAEAEAAGVKDKSAPRRDLAAAMMWLDMAIINGVSEAKDLRSRLGLIAWPEDFALYARYTRMEAAAPCGGDLMTPPSTKTENRP